ncbi:Tyrosinase P [Fulvia fulva]|uniref:Tyrosinase P n=1 Tax=Passalora fulva TaxID=5499 RepID=A0A9Q8UV60_PASFU|nr:Tyrosinase P [Fulvia fulva]KAK4613181.1 hypothetical protein CLAFUR0_13096 [Fulvia fulva]UJO23575.1 Tyrosinase P [Fulvia fulva]WPV36089.1 hypothetical protein CLAFUW7_13095 [Fulvia fulva]
MCRSAVCEWQCTDARNPGPTCLPPHEKHSSTQYDVFAAYPHTHLPPPDAPGVRTRWDEFVYVHAIDTIPDANSIHGSPLLLTFHRAFNAEMQFALRDECGCEGGLPYMDWTKYPGTPMSSWPMFDGSATSLGSNGDTTQHGCRCVTTGPISDWAVNLGSAGEDSICSQNSDPNGMAHNSHCLERLFASSPQKTSPTSAKKSSSRQSLTTRT